MERVVSSTRGARLQRAGVEGAGLVSSSQKGKWGKQDGELLSGPHAPPCLLRKNFQPPPNSIFACQDIWEMQREKTVAYACALQYWVEKTDPPTGGKQCLLAKSVKELQEEMRCYLSFSDKEVFEGLTPPEETSADPAEKAKPHSMANMPAIAPGVQATTKAVEELAVERKSPKFPSWEKVLHPSRPVVAAGQIPHPSESLGWRFCNWETMTTPPVTPSPTRELEVLWQVMLTPSFLGVMACLRSPLPEEVHKASPNPLAVGVMTAPGVATMCTSCIVREESTGATYLDTVTTLVGRVALSGPKQEPPAQGSMIEDMMDLIWRMARYLPLGSRMIPPPLLSRQNKCRPPMGRQACQQPPLGRRTVTFWTFPSYNNSLYLEYILVFIPYLSCSVYLPLC